MPFFNSFKGALKHPGTTCYACWTYIDLLKTIIPLFFECIIAECQNRWLFENDIFDVMFIKFQFFFQELDLLLQWLHRVSSNDCWTFCQHMEYFIFGKLWFYIQFFKTFDLCKKKSNTKNKRAMKWCLNEASSSKNGSLGIQSQIESVIELVSLSVSQTICQTVCQSVNPLISICQSCVWVQTELDDTKSYCQLIITITKEQNHNHFRKQQIHLGLISLVQSQSKKIPKFWKFHSFILRISGDCCYCPITQQLYRMIGEK